VRAAWKSREHRRVVWRPSSRELDVIHNGSIWFASVSPEKDQSTPRYWNSFGSYSKNGDLQIAVEINIPIASNERTVSGFFARDADTGTVYLMHDGAVGGGRKGVGKTTFLAWSGEKLVPVQDSEGVARLGILVTPIEPRAIGGHIARFVRKVVNFKEAVRNGEAIGLPDSTETKRSYDDYYREFSGKKRGRRAKELEYISRHGDIVHALREWRHGHAQPHERIVKNALIDLGIAVSGDLIEIYEVKTSVERQALYTGIGQILVHGGDNGTILRYLVLPDAASMPSDIRKTLNHLEIKVLRFRLSEDTVHIVDQRQQ